MAGSGPGAQKPNLENIPNDIHYLIFYDLDAFESVVLFAVAQVSRALRRAASPFIYRSLVLDRGSRFSKKQETYRAIIERFYDAEFPLAQYVRNLTIKHGMSEAALMSVLDKVSECGILRKLSWKTPAHMPRSVLNKLHATWPNLELSVHVPNRQMSGSHHHHLDSNLLSSPLLQNALCSIYCQGSYSEWPQLTQAIFQGGNIRRLRIQILLNHGNLQMGENMVSDGEQQQWVHLDSTSKTLLPALEEFHVTIQQHGDNPTSFWNQEFILLLNAMDWSRLRKLDVGAECPGIFFSSLEGNLPNLRALRFGVVKNAPWDVLRLIESLTNVESLDIVHADEDLIRLWSAFTKHGSTLKELIVRPSTGNGYQPRINHGRYWASLVEDFPVLERLGWITECEGNRAQIHPHVIRELSKMKLRKLDLFTHLHPGVSEYTFHPGPDVAHIPPLFKDSSRKAGIDIMERVSQAQGRPLEWLTFHFSRTALDDYLQLQLIQAKMQLRRTKHVDAEDDKKYEVRGRQEWYTVPSLEEELWLEEG